jgi:spore photoproduct lyase
VVDVRTSPISERIAAINDFYDAGYKVRLNFSPVIYYHGWLDDYRALVTELADVPGPGVKTQ